MVISKLQIAKQYAANMIQKLWRRQKMVVEKSH